VLTRAPLLKAPAAKKASPQAKPASANFSEEEMAARLKPRFSFSLAGIRPFTQDGDNQALAGRPVMKGLPLPIQARLMDRTYAVSTVANAYRFRHDFAQVSMYPRPALDHQSPGPSSAGTKSLGSYLPLDGSLSSLAGTSVRSVPGLADKHQALAQASHDGIEIDSSMAGVSAPELQPLLAHEAVHIAQQKGSGLPAPRNLLEAEASQLSRYVLSGQPVWPVLSGHSGVPLKQPTSKPKEPTVEELREIDEAWKKAMGPKKTRLDHLKAQLRYLQQLRALIRERQGIETRRNLLDLNMVNLIQAGAEGALVSKVNWKALNISVTPPIEDLSGEIDFAVRFQARFLGRKKADVQADFAKLKSNLQKGVQQVWGQTLGSLPSSVRNYDFNFNVTVSLVDETDPRDDSFWLIDVNPITKRAETHPETNGGFMSVAPTDVDKPDTLGHESLHLFGLADRYRDNLQTGHSESVRGSGAPGSAGIAGKGTGVTRNDPLDTGKGPILPEDLEFVFAHVGVYERVLIANMTPYDTALIKQLGWGRVPRLVDLLDQSETEGAKAAKPPSPSGKPDPLSEQEKYDPQKIIVRKIDGLIMQVNADIDQLTLREHMLDLPDMAPPAKK
jgi:hypothetical protein